VSVLERAWSRLTVPSTLILRVVVRPRYRHAHVDLGREVVAVRRLHAGEELVLRLADVAFDELDAVREVLPLARREIVEDHDVLAAREERFRDV
jgi:hypothetical protein